MVNNRDIWVEAAEIAVKRAELFLNRSEYPGIGDDCFDFGSVADYAWICHQCLYLGIVICEDDVAVKSIERFAEGFALVEYALP